MKSNRTYTRFNEYFIIATIFLIAFSQFYFGFLSLAKSSRNNNSSNPIHPSTTPITLSTTYSSPTELNVDTYYTTDQPGLGGEASLYSRVYLEDGNVYLIYADGWGRDLFLYSDAGYSNLLKSVFDSSHEEYFAFAPSTAAYYYIRMDTDASHSKYLAVFLGNHHSAQEVENGFQINYKDPSMLNPRGVFLFTMPSTENSTDVSDMNIVGPNSNIYTIQIDLESGDCFQKSQFVTVNPRISTAGAGYDYYYDRPEQTFLAITDYEDTFSIQIEREDGSTDPDTSYDTIVLTIVIILIIGIISIVSVLGIRTYLRNRTMFKQSKPVYSSKERSLSPDNQISRLLGMIKMENQIDLNEARKYVKMPKEDIRGLIYELSGEGKVQGHFQGDIFKIEEGMDKFLEELDNSFTEWKMDETKGYGKKI